MAAPPRRPTYDLVVVQELVRLGHWRVTHQALQDAAGLYCEPRDISDCVLALDDADFYKTMPAMKAAGLMQDVYKPRFLGMQLYVKLQIQGPTKRTVVISFKKDEDQ